MKIPLRKLRANMGWYTSTARVPPPRIFRPKKVTPRAGPIAPKLRRLRLRKRRRRTKPHSTIGCIIAWTVVIVFFGYLLAMALGHGSISWLSLDEFGKRAADILR